MIAVTFKFVVCAVILHLAASQTTTTDPFQWGEWTDCQVFRQRIRNCSVVGSCAGSDHEGDVLNFTYCPVCES